MTEQKTPTGGGRDVFVPLASRAGSAAAITSSGFGSSPGGDDGRVPPTMPLARDGHEGFDPDLWRTAVHEAGHACVSRYFDLPVAGSTIVPGVGYSGLTWSASRRAHRGCGDPVAKARQIAAFITQSMPGPGERMDAGVLADVEMQMIVLMGGSAAEVVFFDTSPPEFMASDVRSAHAIGIIVCRTEASRTALIEHCFEEARAIIEANRPAVAAVARVLMEKKTLDGREIDEVIAAALAHQSLTAEHERRKRWLRVVESAARFGADRGERT